MKLNLETLKSQMYGLGRMYDRGIDNELMDMYWLALRGYPDGDVKSAFTQAIKTCKYFPRIADILEFLEPPQKGEALVSWSYVLGLLGKGEGLRNQYLQTDGATAEAVRALGGWYQLTHMPQKDVNYLEKKFVAVYEAAKFRGLANQPAQIIGPREKDWRTGGYLPLTEATPKILNLPGAEFPKQITLEPEENRATVIVDNATQKLKESMRLN